MNNSFMSYDFNSHLREKQRETEIQLLWLQGWPLGHMGNPLPALILENLGIWPYKFSQFWPIKKNQTNEFSFKISAP